MSSIIQAENIGKCYRIRHNPGASHTTLVDVLAEKARTVTNLARGRHNESPSATQDFWALKDVNFEINQGERVGIIGRNGGGKSTLLKVLSRITHPTTGKITFRGKMASLLEVGTGFHLELTGRENIFLNGAILGMKRDEIARKFDEIVEFAEIEKFLDTPVKRYSSGMFVRLAFAVAAHLEPDILVVDEVLAVGDAQFQKKCLGKMEDVGREGRTVLFVSHDMRAVKVLCSHGIVLKKGISSPKMALSEAMDLYHNDIKSAGIGLPVTINELTIQDFIVSQAGVRTTYLTSDEPIDITVGYTLTKRVKDFRIGVYLKSNVGENIFRSCIADWEPELEDTPPGDYTAKLSLPANIVHGGAYVVSLNASKYCVGSYLGHSTVETQVTVQGPKSYNLQHVTEPVEGSIVMNERWTVTAGN
jgi:lipopolysaccharide transport system ATP-binding protein